MSNKFAHGDWVVSDSGGEMVGISIGPHGWGHNKGLFTPEEARQIAKTIMTFADQIDGKATSVAPAETRSETNPPVEDYWSRSLLPSRRQSR